LGFQEIRINKADAWLHFSYAMKVRILVRSVLLFPFGGFWGVCENSCNAFLLLFVMILWVPIFAMLCRKAVPMLWHVSLFLGLCGLWGFFLFTLSLSTGGFHCFFL
jgi:hypothetical protein